MRSGLLLVMVLATSCGGGPDPILRNVPQPNAGAMAGAAAAIAGAATLASPDAAAKRAEANKSAAEQKPVVVRENVPADVFDRLEDQRDPAAPTPFVDQPPAPAMP